MCSPGRVDDESLLHELREIRAPHPRHGLHNANVEDGGHGDAAHVHDQQVADLRQMGAGQFVEWLTANE